jgi:hypothetical protein
LRCFLELDDDRAALEIALTAGGLGKLDRQSLENFVLSAPA